VERNRALLESLEASGHSADYGRRFRQCGAVPVPDVLNTWRATAAAPAIRVTRAGLRGAGHAEERRHAAVLASPGT